MDHIGQSVLVQCPQGHQFCVTTAELESDYPPGYQISDAPLVGAEHCLECTPQVVLATRTIQTTPPNQLP